MNAPLKRKSMIAFCVIAFSPMASAAQAQEAVRHLTIADCPAGYVLGVEDIAEPQPLTRDPNAVAGNPPGQNAVTAAAQQVAAPRQFVTGCIPPQSQQLPTQPTEDFHGNFDDAQ